MDYDKIKWVGVQYIKMLILRKENCFYYLLKDTYTLRKKLIYQEIWVGPANGKASNTYSTYLPNIMSRTRMTIWTLKMKDTSYYKWMLREEYLHDLTLTSCRIPWRVRSLTTAESNPKASFRGSDVRHCCFWSHFTSFHTRRCFESYFIFSQSTMIRKPPLPPICHSVFCLIEGHDVAFNQ